MQPTYSAEEIKAICSTTDFDYDSYKILIELIEQEIDHYTSDELVTLAQASVIALNRVLLKLFKK